MANVAINGLGRIGRAALKIITDTDGLDVVAVNDIVPADNLAYLLRYDTVYGRYHRQVVADADAISIDGRSIPVFGERDPAALPWSELEVDLVLECTGAFREEQDLRKHIDAGARFVILSAPAKTETIATAIPGVNDPDGGLWKIKTVDLLTAPGQFAMAEARVLAQNMGRYQTTIEHPDGGLRTVYLSEQDEAEDYHRRTVRRILAGQL